MEPAKDIRYMGCSNAPWRTQMPDVEVMCSLQYKPLQILLLV